MSHDPFWLVDKKTLNEMRNLKMPCVLLKKLRQMFIIEMEIFLLALNFLVCGLSTMIADP